MTCFCNIKGNKTQLGLNFAWITLEFSESEKSSSLFWHWVICQFVFREILIPGVMGTTGNDWFLITSQISSRTTNFVEPNDTTLNDGENLVLMERKKNAKWSNNKKNPWHWKGLATSFRHYYIANKIIITDQAVFLFAFLATAHKIQIVQK